MATGGHAYGSTSCGVEAKFCRARTPIRSADVVVENSGSHLFQRLQRVLVVVYEQNCTAFAVSGEDTCRNSPTNVGGSDANSTQPAVVAVRS